VTNAWHLLRSTNLRRADCDSSYV